MRVAHLTTVDSTLRFVLFRQLQAVLDTGGEAVGISAPGPYVAELERAGIRHLALPSSTRAMHPLRDLRAARDLWRILRRERFDVLHTHNPKPGLYGRIVGRLAGVPIIVNTVHGLYATQNDHVLKRLLVYGLEAFADRFSDAELVLSSEDFALLTRWGITRRGSTRLLGSGVDLARFDPDRFTQEDRRRYRRRLGIEESHVVVGIVARLVAEKGYPELFTAASLLGRGYTILAIGPEEPDKPDALPSSLLREAAGRGVRFVGMRPDVDELCAAMDIFVLPSRREGIPLAAMEAAAMGLPVVATDIRGCREVVEHGINGFLVPAGDAQALAEAIRKLGNEPALRQTMGRAARDRARDRFDERQVVRTVLDIYRQVAARKGVPLVEQPGDAPGATAGPQNAGNVRGATR
ncbi:MAG: glycosyltransferase family 4 protein [Actinomycetota bacterium]